MSRKAALAIVVAAGATGGAWLVSPRLGGIVLIVVALSALAAFAYRLL